MARERPVSAERAKRGRNIALGLFLGFLVVFFFVMTIVRMGDHVMHR